MAYPEDYMPAFSVYPDVKIRSNNVVMTRRKVDKYLPNLREPLTISYNVKIREVDLGVGRTGITLYRSWLGTGFTQLNVGETISIY